MINGESFLIDEAVSRLKSVLISVPELNAVDNPLNNTESNTEICANNPGNDEVKPSLSGVASVLLPLLQVEGEWHILLTLRAQNMRHHGGEVAFPGGMWEQGDKDLVMTALRECEEEIAITPDSISILGGLLPSYTRSLTRVRPIVGIVSSLERMTANPSEIAEIFTVPLTFFIADSRIRTDIFTHQDSGLTHWMPAYDYQGYEIWGFTAAVIVQLINRCVTGSIVDSFVDRFAVNTDDIAGEIIRQHSAPEKIWIY